MNEAKRAATSRYPPPNTKSMFRNRNGRNIANAGVEDSTTQNLVSQ